MEMLERSVSLAQRHKRPLSLMMFDIDHFKKINDTHGHLAGDIILRDLCQRILPFIRKDEIFARYGGEEFIVLLPEVSAEQAFPLAEKILKAIQLDVFKVEQVDIPVTISIGIAQLDVSKNMSANDLICAADAKLYVAKDNGRNCVKV